MGVPLNHLRIYTKDGSQNRVKGVATENGTDDGTKKRSNKEVSPGVSGSGQENESQCNDLGTTMSQW